MIISISHRGFMMGAHRESLRSFPAEKVHPSGYESFFFAMLSTLKRAAQADTFKISKLVEGSIYYKKEVSIFTEQKKMAMQCFRVLPTHWNNNLSYTPLVLLSVHPLLMTLSVGERGEIVGMWKAGRTPSEIARFVGQSRATVVNVIQRYREIGNEEPRESPGHPKTPRPEDVGRKSCWSSCLHCQKKSPCHSDRRNQPTCR
jgi:hypothetical protein